MPYISRLQSTINKLTRSAGNKKAGLVYSSDYSRIPTNTKIKNINKYSI